MNFLSIPLGKQRRARAWINGSPIDICNSEAEYVREFQSSRLGIVDERRIVIEVAIPTGFTSYGLLGGKIECVNSGFEFVVRTLSGFTNLFQDALVSSDSDEIRVGLCDEFLPTVTRSFEECINTHGNDLPNARMIIDVAACAAVGSNPKIFKELSKILFSALIVAESLTEESLQRSIQIAFCK